MNTIRVSNNLGRDKALCFAWPDLSQNSLQRPPADHGLTIASKE